MAITRGNITTHYANRVYAASSPYFVSHNNNGDTVVLDVGSNNGTSQPLTGVKYAGVAMTLDTTRGITAGTKACYRYVLVGAAAGVNNIEYTTPVDNFQVTLVVRSFSGVHQTTPFRDTDNMEGTMQISNPALTLTTVSGDLGIDFVWVIGDNSNGSPNAGQTGDAAIDGGTNRAETSYEEATGASTAMGWDGTTFAFGAPFGYIASALQPAAGGVPTIEEYSWSPMLAPPHQKMRLW